ncbi:molecular chaperone DnaJ [Actinoplanes solisilvae]|uniref:molecular chaperone DnaJ n=1 Tax=Actinoplanes solisilvae TaxID=2486853 RepID=UPI000FDA1E80|nr:molecular chaperone DnaJ [Actinoplanes solisilvae]
MMFGEAAERIRNAATFEELITDGGEEATYRAYAKAVHPDAAADSEGATHAFAQLARLYRDRGRRLAVGDIADLIRRDDTTITKIPRDPADSDLMEAEAAALRRLRDEGDPRYRPYAPKLIDSYLHEDPERRRRRVNVQERLVGFVALDAVEPRDARDIAWIWRRLLVGLGWAHRAGVVHGAVLEEHVLIHPEQHGVALVDWCYSGTRVKAVVARRKDVYPPEVLKDKNAGPATDIYMATGLMTRLIEDPPKPLRRFADGCLYDAPRMRPQDAWRLLAELDDILHSLYGPRTFRPFIV